MNTTSRALRIDAQTLHAGLSNRVKADMVDLVNDTMSSCTDGHQGVNKLVHGILTFLQSELKFYSKPEKSTIISKSKVCRREPVITSYLFESASFPKVIVFDHDYEMYSRW
jgi:hypothetical protein